ncbi:MAG: hypothetical protein EHM58_00445 [Ignavibacteriae bacterium]|nr:MAG: hypothetical protein EHM58_00445 [Ignavibacteriota bacterium]
MSFVFNGKTYDIPGSYGILEVIQNSGANIPDFQVGLIIGRSIKGIPYSVSGKTGSELMPAYDNGNDLLRDFGDDNIYKAYKYMAKHGGGLVFVLNSMSNTACEASLKDTTTPTPKDAIKLVAKENWYGVCANDISLTLIDTPNEENSKTLTLIPPKNVKRLVEDSGTYFIYVNSINGLSEGMDVYLTSNVDTSPDPYKIKRIDGNWDPNKKGYKITFDSVIATAATVTSFGRIFQKDEDNKETIKWATSLTNAQIVDELNEHSNLVTATLTDDTAIALDDHTTSVYLQDIAITDKKGKSLSDNVEAASNSNYSNICDSFPNWMKDFINANKVKIRLVYVDSPDVTVHGYFRDLAVTMRAQERSPICVIAGAAFGEEVSDLTDRGSDLNSDDFILCGGGADSLPAYLTLAPSVLGIKMSYGINHNLTRDQLNFSSVERDWSNSQITSLLKKGILTYDKFPSGYRIVRGINTYQDQTHVWNAQDKKTYLQMPRDLADAFFRGLLEGLDNDLVGSDQVTRKKVETYCVKTGNNFVASGLINDFKVLSIKRGEAGWLPEIQIEVDDPTDFFGTRIFVISPSLD